jgi:hypothetical protein
VEDDLTGSLLANTTCRGERSVRAASVRRSSARRMVSVVVSVRFSNLGHLGVRSGEIARDVGIRQAFVGYAAPAESTDKREVGSSTLPRPIPDSLPRWPLGAKRGLFWLSVNSLGVHCGVRCYPCSRFRCLSAARCAEIFQRFVFHRGANFRRRLCHPTGAA